MKQIILGALLISIGTFIGSFSTGNLSNAAIAQFAPPMQTGDALWHLPNFSDEGWFLHASNGRVRGCNMDKVSVVDNRPGPRCSNWE